MDADKRIEHLLQAAVLMEQALELLDAAGEGHAGALLDHAIAVLPGRANAMREERTDLSTKGIDD